MATAWCITRNRARLAGCTHATLQIPLCIKSPINTPSNDVSSLCWYPRVKQSTTTFYTRILDISHYLIVTCLLCKYINTCGMSIFNQRRTSCGVSGQASSLTFKVVTKYKNIEFKLVKVLVFCQFLNFWTYNVKPEICI